VSAGVHVRRTITVYGVHIIVLQCDCCIDIRYKIPTYRPFKYKNVAPRRAVASGHIYLTGVASIDSRKIGRYNMYYYFYKICAHMYINGCYCIFYRYHIVYCRCSSPCTRVGDNSTPRLVATKT